MTNRKLLFIAAAPLLLLFGMMLCFRIVAALPAGQTEVSSEIREITLPAPKMIPADADTQKALIAPVRGQLSAIRKGDYAAAMTFSGASFRESWNPKRFQELVETDFKEMTESTKEEFETGRVAENAANLRVVVTTTDNARIGFIYNLVREGDSWFVQACSPGYPLGSGSDAIEGGEKAKRQLQSGPPVMSKL